MSTSYTRSPCQIHWNLVTQAYISFHRVLNAKQFLVFKDLGVWMETIICTVVQWEPPLIWQTVFHSCLSADVFVIPGAWTLNSTLCFWFCVKSCPALYASRSDADPSNGQKIELVVFQVWRNARENIEHVVSLPLGHKHNSTWMSVCFMCKQFTHMFGLLTL